MNPTLRMKMRVTYIEERFNSDADGRRGAKNAESITLDAVYGSDGTANKEWSQMTPFGHLQFSVTNPNAFGRLKQGDFMFLDLTPCSEDAR